MTIFLFGTLPVVAQTPLPGPAVGGFFLDDRFQGNRIPPGFGGLDAFALPFGSGPAANAPGPGRAWSITPTLDVQLLGTDNVSGTTTNRRSELITTVTPGIIAEVELARLTGRLTYTPSVLFYARDRDANGVNHSFSGQALATVVEDTLFLDLRGFGGVQAIGGGFTPEGSTVLSRRDQVQTASFQASPYLLHRFGDFATAQVGYAYGYTLQDGQAAYLPGSSLPFFTSQATTSQQVYGVLRSGPAFGRLGATLDLNSTDYSGTGVLAGGYRRVASLELAYAVTRQVAVLVEGGYEDLRFGGTDPVEVSGPIWSVGMRLNPDPNSQIVVRYGRRDGFNSFSLDGGVDVGVRTRLFATYSEQLSTGGLLAQGLLSSAAVDRDGNFVSPTSGAPITSPFGGSLLASQNTLQRTRRGTLGATQLFDRDTITLLFTYDDRTPVTSAVGTQGFAQEGVSAGLTWTRLLTPNLTGSLTGQYGRTESRVAGSGDVYTLRASLARELAPGLLGTVQYLFSSRSTETVSGRAPQNIATIGLRQTF